MDKHYQFQSYLNQGMCVKKALQKAYMPDTKHEKLEACLIVAGFVTNILFFILPKLILS